MVIVEGDGPKGMEIASAPNQMFNEQHTKNNKKITEFPSRFRCIMMCLFTFVL